MSGWNAPPPSIPMRRRGDGAAGAAGPPLGPPAPRVSPAVAHWVAVATDERRPYSDRALACRVVAAIAAAEAALSAQAQTLALLGISDKLSAIQVALDGCRESPPGAPQPD